MEPIDPHNLGDPVYKGDQVITIDDLKMLEKHYKELEVQMTQAGYIVEAAECCHTHLLMERLQDWLKDGKPKEAFNRGEDTQDS